MDVKSENFILAAEIAVKDEDLQTALKRGTTAAYQGRQRALFAYGKEHGEAIRQQTAEAKRRALRDLPALLEEAERHMQANGIQVLWAQNSDEVNRLVLDIAREHDVKLVTKSKSMVSEEVALNPALEAGGIRVVETDLGEFIIQVAEEPPGHIVAPAIHKTKESVRDLFIEKLEMPPTDDAQEMTHFARRHLREIFLEADMGVSGGNFIIAETGTLCLLTNEGNGRMVTTLPRVHVAIVGIEKIIPTMADYGTLVQILARSASGQGLPVYSHLLNGPRQESEPDGPDFMYVILVDNGRTGIYETNYNEALACIRCGACLNACPVFQVTGGHTYGWVYPGPIGSVITPLYVGLENASPLPNASSLCNKCKEVCPVDIDLPRMLLDLRRDMVDQGLSSTQWNVGIKMWSVAVRSPRLFAFSGMTARVGRNLFSQNFPGILGEWTKYRDFPPFAPKPFRQLWQERQKHQKSGGAHAAEKGEQSYGD